MKSCTHGSWNLFAWLELFQVLLIPAVLAVIDAANANYLHVQMSDLASSAGTRLFSKEIPGFKHG